MTIKKKYWMKLIYEQIYFCWERKERYSLNDVKREYLNSGMVYMRMDDVIAVILGGGRGTRLYPLTALRAKPAVPFGGKYRMIDIPISNCINSKIYKIFVLTQFLVGSLHRHIQGAYKFDHFSTSFVELLPAEQTLTSEKWYQGTADAVRRKMHRFIQWMPDDVLILAGDHLYRMDYRKFIRFHREKEADVTIAVKPISAEDAPRFGILTTDKDGRILSFHEKPGTRDELRGLESFPGSEKPYLGSMGIYLFKKKVLETLLEGGGEDFGNEIIPGAIGSSSLYAYPFEGYWEDIGTISAFYNANLALTRSGSPSEFYPHTIYTHSEFLPPTQMNKCRTTCVVMAEGCFLGNIDLEECVIGLRSIIQKDTILKRVIMMGADYYENGDVRADNLRLGRPCIGIGEGSRIERVIIDKNARIGRGVIINSHRGEPDRDEKCYSIRDGIVVIHKNATVPDGMII